MANTFIHIAPYLGATGSALINLDENKTGADDFAGELLVYGAEVLAAVDNGADIPEFPDVLKTGVSDRITGAARVSLIVANSILTVAQFQVGGRAAQVLKYINQAIRNLLAGTAVAPPKV